MKKQTYRYIGKLKPGIANYWKLEEHSNKPIIIYDNVKQHIMDKHLKDFGSKKEIDYAWKRISSVIKSPDQVFYNKSTKGLEYYKRLNNNIVVAVRVNKGNVLKVKSIYPANKGKMKNRKNKEEQLKIDGEINDDVNNDIYV